MNWNKINESEEDLKNIPDANDITSGKRLYIIEYGVRGRKNTNDMRKLVETDSIEKHINDNYVIGYSWNKGDKIFTSAIEVVKVGLKYVVPLNADYWYTNPITFNTSELKHSCLENGKFTWYDYDLKGWMGRGI